MIKIYIGKKILDLPIIEILYPNMGKRESLNLFGERIFSDLATPFVTIVDKPEEADFLCIPHTYQSIKHNQTYIDEFVTLSNTFSKKILVFLIGDSDEDVPLKNALVFRHSQYLYKKKPYEIMLPAYAVDLGKLYGTTLRQKTDKPTVGFCGWAGHISLKRRVGYIISTVRHALGTRGTQGHAYVERKGLFFRKKALRILAQSTEVIPRIIIRTSYGGNAKTITVDPQTSRKEYVDNMKNADMVLCVKGDGNFSVRFYEALSLGRVPLLLDTGCVLPLSDVIDYDSFIIRVDYRDIRMLPHIAAQKYGSLTVNDFIAMQKRARDAFEQYLNIESFLRFILTKEQLEKYAPLS